MTCEHQHSLFPFLGGEEKIGCNFTAFLPQCPTLACIKDSQPRRGWRRWLGLHLLHGSQPQLHIEISWDWFSSSGQLSQDP